MALKKSIPYGNTGINCEYWRILRYSVDRDNMKVSVVVGGYITKDLRDSGSSHLQSLSIDVPADGWDAVNEANIYKALMDEIMVSIGEFMTFEKVDGKMIPNGLEEKFENINPLSGSKEA